MKIKTNTKAGSRPGAVGNHNQSSISVKTKIKAGGSFYNHNQTDGVSKAISLKTNIKAGRGGNGSWTNHNQIVRLTTGN